MKSIDNAIFDSSINLIISLDGGYSKESLVVAKKFASQFAKGSVEIIAREVNLGLRQHILWCGDQTERFGSVIVLEEDLLVDPQFYIYAKQAALFYQNDSRIGGISLYAQEFNEYSGLPFIPLKNGTSCYFMQVASSWGQLWTLMQWNDFKIWYKNNDENELLKIKNLPKNVKSWPESSWKKYYSGYLSKRDKFIVYPYQSYSTNVSDIGGTHISNGTSFLQTNFLYSERSLDKFNFPELESINSVYYDSFMEPASKFIYSFFNLNDEELTIDVYGTKPLDLLRSYKYAVTSKSTKSFIKKIPLSFRPIENSILKSTESGTGFLYFTKTINIIDLKIHNKIGIIEYFCGISLQRKYLLKIIIISLIRRVVKKIKNKFSKSNITNTET
ncbi:glycosyltransferase family protein [Orrella marina]|uniref:hypothetical protein n=1 Tax=Orrella marina TaxID=2163011 RepID=UPI00131EDDD7|nr:hypothetical protein [Orrella marina]